MNDKNSSLKQAFWACSAPLRFSYGIDFYPWQRLTARYYLFPSAKIQRPVRLALISDLHKTCYGKEQTELLSLISAGKPDAILLAGDMMEYAMPHPATDRLLSALADAYPCYYVTGNHEFYTGEADAIKSHIASFSIRVLEGDYCDILLNRQPLRICGIDDPRIGKSIWRKQLLHTADAVDGQAFTLLLAHQPSLLEIYSRFGFDLVVSGHAHGGQWRTASLPNGVFATGQGLLPEYTGGVYRCNQSGMIVSRGLAKSILPRFGNPPEAVFIKLIPQK